MKKSFLIFALLMTLMALDAIHGQAFITTWKTDNPGTSNDNQITIPTLGGGGGYNYDIDWGDGTIDEGITSDAAPTHTYATAGTYTVSITGSFPRFSFPTTAASDNQKLLTVEQWGDIVWNNFAFRGCTNLIVNATDAPDLSNANLIDTFEGCSNFNSNINHWNITPVDFMQDVFKNATAFNQPLDNWDVSNVTEMSGLFSGADVFNQPLDNWDVSKVEDMKFMFADADEFNQDLNSWDVSSVTDMSFMFNDADAFNGDISSWDVSSVTNMGSMFDIARNFNGDISQWDVSAVENFSKTFNGAFDFNQDISGWNVGNATSMTRMFLAAADFDQDLSGWNVSNVQRMDFMLVNAQSFDADISGWDVSNVTNMTQMLELSGLSKINYDKLLNGWSQLTLQSGVSFGAAGFTYCNGASGRAILEAAPNNWVITDDGEECLPFITTWKTDNSGTSNDNQITIPTGMVNSPDFDIDWGDGNSDLNVAGGNITHTYASPGTYTVSISGKLTSIGFNNNGDEDKLLTVEQWGDNEGWFSMSFNGASNLEIVATDAPNLSSARTLSSAFQNCENFNSSIGHWDVSAIEFMQSTFKDATSFDQDLSNWDVGSVTNMREMFRGTPFNQDINDWNVSRVTTMLWMFQFAEDFNQDIGDWNVGSVTDMQEMFNGATAFNKDISDWDVTSVETMSGMFRNSAFNQDISSWDMSSVRFTGSMFQNTPFNQDLSGWNTSNIEDFVRMFEGATEFNQNISGWNTSNVTNMNSMFNGASSFDQDLGSWDISSVSFMNLMLDNSGLSISNYDKLLNGWASQTVQSGVTLGAAGIEYCSGATGRSVLTNAPNNWTINDGGENCNVNIPDANLKAALLANSSINTTDDGEITLQEAEVFTGTIEAINLGISDLTGIEAFTLLRGLNVSNNNISTIDVSNNLGLRTLRIGGNTISEIDISQNVELTNFIISGCPISEIDISNNPLLITFTASENLLTTLDLTNNPDLRSLAIYDQPNLTEIDFQNGNNEEIVSSLFSNNPALTCFKVDNVGYARLNYESIDDPSVFKFTCNPDEIVDIPDANFKAELLANAAINTTDDGEITVSEAEAFTGSIIVFAKDVTDATGIEYFSNINVLNFTSNDLTEIDISNNTELDFIVLTANELTEIDVSNNPLIRFLFINDNDLSDIDVSQNTQLKELLIQDNSLGALDVSSLASLERLLASNNVIESFDLSQNPSIDEFKMDGNQLTSLNLRNGNAEAIFNFDITGNTGLTCASVDDPIYSVENWTNVDDPAIFSFSCDPDETVEIPDANFKAALLADISINTVDDGEITYGEAEAFAGTIDVSASSIVDLTGIEAFANIEVLQIYDNEITDLDVRYNTLLTDLWAWENELTSIDVSRNTELSNFLILSDNNIGSIDLSNNVKLRNLQLNNCGLSGGVDLSSLTDLRALSIRSNGLTTVDLTNNTLLSDLRIEFNEFASIDLAANTAITQLRVASNPLTSLDVAAQTSLTTLYADNTEILDLDVSGNTALHTFSMINGTLNSLNIANGNNSNFVAFTVRNHPDLSCITVDDVAFSEANWSDQNNGASFSTDCSNEENDFLTFSFTEETGAASIDVANHTIDSEVALGTDPTSLVPAFTISAGATIDQASGVAQDFSAPFTYTITAENPNAVQEWVVTVSEENADPTDISLHPSAIDENNLIDAVIGTFTTTDANSADEHSYALVAGTGDEDNASFGIIDDELIALEVFDFETKTSYSIRVQTDDDNGGVYEEAFTISINDLPSSLVGINLSNTEIDENQDAGTALGTLSPSGDDLGTSFTYELVAGEGDEDNASFTIEEDQLRSNASFNFEVQEAFSIRIEVTGDGSSFSQSFEIAVNDVAEAPTDIALSNSQIAENNDIDALIGALSTTDEDANEVFTYTLVTGEGDDDNSSFLVVEDQLLANEVFDFETKASYSIRIETNDGNSGTLQKVFTIQVTNASEAPTDLMLSASEITENNAIGDVIGTFSTIDVDANETYTYSLVEGDGDEDNALFTIDADALQAGAAFDFESTSVYSIRVETNDGNGGTLQEIFEIVITDVNEGIVVVNALDDQTLNLGFGSLELSISDVFEDEDGDDLTFEVASSNEEVATVAISESNIVITEEGEGTAIITMTAADGNGESASDEFTLSIVDPNDPPVVTNAISDITLEEGFVSSQVSLVDVFSDPDNDVLTITAQSSNLDVVEVAVEDDQLTLTEVGLGTSIITVTANDGNGSTVSDEFTVTIVEANNPPVVVNPIKDTELEEGFASTQISLTEVFSDPDNDDLTFTASSSNRTVLEISIVNDQLELTEVGLGTSTIIVTADDGNGGTVSNEFMVTVVEVEDVLGFEDQLNIQVYPNPVVNSLQIKALESVDVRLTDLNGRLLNQGRGHAISLDLTNENEGVYLLLIQHGSQQITRRIFKTN